MYLWNSKSIISTFSKVEKSGITFSMKEKYYIKTYGCQMNFYDSEKLAVLLNKKNFQRTDKIEDASFVFVNTCSVRKHAEERAFGFLSSIKNTNKIFCLIGCTANLYGEKIFEQLPFIDVVCGPNTYKKLVEVLPEIKKGEKVILTGESEDPFIEETGEIKGKISSFITISKGCENFCSYCVVPFTRGKLINKPVVKIIEEIEELVKNGVKEIILIGQNVNEYRYENYDFVDLIYKVAEIEGIERFGFLTSHPKDIPEKLLKSFSEIPNVYKHLHFPLQSGSDRILEKMNRKYTVEKYLKIVEKSREICPEISLTSDIIVGFPKETEEDFRKTYNIVERTKFDDLFVFKYSPRPKTVASKFPETVSQEEKEKRHRIILNLQDKISLLKNKERIGEISQVLCLKESKKKKNFLIGRDIKRKVVLFEGEKNQIGKIVKIKITGVTRHYLLGQLCENNK